MDRRRTLMTLAMASAALAPARGGEDNGGSRALDGVWSVHVTPGPGSPPASPETDTLILYKNGMLLEDNGAVDNRGGQASGSGVQFGFYRFLGSGVFESVSWKVIAGLFGPALVKLQVTIEMLSATEYKGQIAGSVLDWNGKDEGINFTLYTQAKLLGREIHRA